MVEGKAEIFLEKNEENEVPVKVECPQEYVIRRACLACVNHKGYSFTGAYVYALWHCDLPLGDNVYSYSFGSCDTDPDITYKSSYEDKTPIKCKYDEGCTVVKYVRALYCKS